MAHLSCRVDALIVHQKIFHGLEGQHRLLFVDVILGSMIGVFCRQMVRLQSRKLRVRLLESKQRWLLRSLRTSASADRRRVTPPRPNANFQVTLLQKKTGEHRCGMGQYQGSYPAGDTASSPQPETVSPRIATHSSPQPETVSPK